MRAAAKAMIQLEDPQDLMSKLRTTRNVLPTMKKCSEVRRRREERELRKFRGSGGVRQLVTYDSLPYVNRHSECVTGLAGFQDDVPDHPGAETQLRTCLLNIEGSQWEEMAVLATRAAETTLTGLDNDSGDDGGGSRERSMRGGAETQLQRAMNLACESQWERQAVKASLEAEIHDLERRKQKKQTSLHDSQYNAKSSDLVKGTETQLLDAAKRIADPLWELYAERASLEAEVSTLQAKKTILTEIATQEDDGEQDNQDDHNRSSSSNGEASGIAEGNDDNGSACDLTPQAQSIMESQVLLTQTYRETSAPATQHFALNAGGRRVDSFGDKSKEDEHRSANDERYGDAQDSDDVVISPQAQNTMESEVLLTQTDRQTSSPAVRNFDMQDKDEGWITKQTPCTSPAKPFTQCLRTAPDELDSLLASSPETKCSSNSPLLLPIDADGDGRGGDDDDDDIERSRQNDDHQKRKISISPTKSLSSEDIDEPRRKPSLKRIKITLAGPVRGNNSKGYQRVTAQQQRSDGWLNRRTELDRKCPRLYMPLLQHCLDSRLLH